MNSFSVALFTGLFKLEKLGHVVLACQSAVQHDSKYPKVQSRCLLPRDVDREYLFGDFFCCWDLWVKCSHSFGAWGWRVGVTRHSHARWGSEKGVRLKCSEVKQKVAVSGNDDCMNCMTVGQPKNKETYTTSSILLFISIALLQKTLCCPCSRIPLPLLIQFPALPRRTAHPLGLRRDRFGSHRGTAAGDGKPKGTRSSCRILSIFLRLC